MFRIRYLYLSLLVLCFSCQKKAKEDKLLVACAASVQFAAKKIVEEFSTIYNIPVEIISSSSGKLTTQIINGAPYDIFLAANTFYPEVLANKNKTEGEVIIYGDGLPVIWTNQKDLSFHDIKQTLLSDAVDKIAIADPKNAPYGEMAVNYLKDMGLYDQLEHKLVFGESISQVNEYLLSKNVQIAFGAKTIVKTPKLADIGKYITLDEKYAIAHGLVVIRNNKSMNMKNRFLDFINTDKGQKILDRYGFIL